MGICAKASCHTETKDVFTVAQAIAKDINAYIKQFKKPRFQRDDDNSLVTIEMSSSSQMVTLNFKVKGETRGLTVHFDCDVDGYDKFGKGSKSICASLNVWGLSDELILIVAKTFNQFGPTKYTLSDYSQAKYKTFKEVKIA